MSLESALLSLRHGTQSSVGHCFTTCNGTDLSLRFRRAAVKQTLAELARPALHAQTLGFSHPITGERLQFSCPLPPDFETALHSLRAM